MVTVEAKGQASEICIDFQRFRKMSLELKSLTGFKT
jgi:hypothetical protein